MAGEASLEAPNDAIITQHYARNIFGKENPIGKVLEYYGKNITIKGVIGELDCKSLLQFDILVSYRLIERWQRMDISLMRILPGVNLDKINKISNVYRKDKRGNRIRWKFIAWKDLYWENSIGHDDDYDSIMQFGNRTHLYILSGVTILLLLVGILNFINIYMVFMMKRSKEYGVKKYSACSVCLCFTNMDGKSVISLCRTANRLAVDRSNPSTSQPVDE